MTRHEIMLEIRDYAVVALATSLYAVGVTLFMLPYELATGGVAGIAALIFYATGVKVEVTYALINCGLLACGAKVLGWRFSLKTIWGFGFISFWLWFIQMILEDPVTHELPRILNESEILLATILCALLEGSCLAICFQYRGSTGGTDIIAAIVNKFYDISLGQIIILMDCVIVSSSYLLFHDFRKVIYGFVLLVLSGLVLDYVTRVFNKTIVVYIFSRNYTAIADAVNKAGFGLTVIDGTGWYTKTERKVLMCVCTKRHSHEVMEAVKKVDPTAFVTITSAINVYGEGFDKMKTRIKGQKPILVFATNNENKLREVRQILEDRYEVRSLKEVGCFTDVPETHGTLEGNALEKAQYISHFYGFDCFADDTGLEIQSLGGAPGVYSARYASILGEGDTENDSYYSCDHDSQANMQKVLHKLEGKTGKERRAQFRTVFALIKDGQTHTFEGIVKGNITEEKRGTDGFGYDPIFQPEGYDLTFAEMFADEKNKISHRGRAVEKLVEFLNKEKANK